MSNVSPETKGGTITLSYLEESEEYLVGFQPPIEEKIAEGIASRTYIIAEYIRTGQRVAGLKINASSLGVANGPFSKDRRRNARNFCNSIVGSKQEGVRSDSFNIPSQLRLKDWEIEIVEEELKQA